MLRSRPKLSPCGWQVVVALFWVGLALAWASADASGRVPSARVAKRMTPGLRRVVMRGFSSARDAVVERDGRVLVATDGGIVGLRADGSLDRAFGRAGLLRVRAGGREMGAAALALDRDHFLVAGIPSGKKGVIGVLRYTLRGRLDRRFGSAGLAAVRPPRLPGLTLECVLQARRLTGSPHSLMAGSSWAGPFRRLMTPRGTMSRTSGSLASPGTERLIHRSARTGR